MLIRTATPYVVTAVFTLKLSEPISISDDQRTSSFPGILTRVLPPDATRIGSRNGMFTSRVNT